jgi:hypothetical protein
MRIIFLNISISISINSSSKGKKLFCTVYNKKLSKFSTHRISFFDPFFKQYFIVHPLQSIWWKKKSSHMRVWSQIIASIIILRDFPLHFVVNIIFDVAKMSRLKRDVERKKEEKKYLFMRGLRSYSIENHSPSPTSLCVRMNHF